ncbi:MAG: phosphate ABC transporter permease PstA [Synergistaceae bacterium]|jgi:phosphate transport system permease protein|nr:phosphate ABC transporter permease PstA [Synergistaceae bacterium]
MRNKNNKKLSEFFMASITHGAALTTLGILSFLVIFIFVKGVFHITPSLFSPSYNSQNVSLTPALVSTVLMTPMALLITTPLGVFAAIYLTEYARRGNKWVGLVRVTTEVLSGIPSIVYGLFGSLFFVLFLGWGYSVLAGVFTLSIMILPLIMRSSEEALKSVPDAYREGAFGLGAGKLRTVFKIVLPSAMPGILAGVILAIGRIVGETAALIYTAGTVAQIPQNPMQSARTLSVHMYALSTEGFHTDESYATAVVLLFVVILINAASLKISRWIGGPNCQGDQEGGQV